MRTTRHRRAVLAVAAVTALSAAACSSSTTNATSGGSTPGGTSAGGGAPVAAGGEDISIPFSADMQAPDPDIFYEVEGNAVTTSVYEGLVRYKPDSTEIEGAIAEKFEASADGKTYTFKLRSGVKFHDGTAVDAAAAKASFERRTNVNSAPAYMLADVDTYETPDASTFVVKLKQPVAPFLDYLAAPYGPKLVSPTVLKEKGGSDFAQSWLKEHDAGSGPYTISEFTNGTKYVITRFDDYWGGKPAVKSVTMQILPDISTQRLKLESGELTMIMHGLSAADIESIKKNDGFQVKEFPAFYKTFIMVNQNKDAFKDKDTRNAFQAAVDKDKILKEVFGSTAVKSTQIYPAGMLPPDKAKDDIAKDPSKLSAMAGKFSGKTVDIGFTSDDPRNGRAAELVQTDLQAAGITATTRAIPLTQAFDLPNNKDQAPDLMVSTLNPDAAHPDTWARIFMSTKGSLNWLQCSVPEADKALDEGLNGTDKTKIADAYAKAGDLLVDSGCFVTISDDKEVIVSKKGYSDFVHQMPTLNTIRFKDLKLG